MRCLALLIVREVPDPLDGLVVLDGLFDFFDCKAFPASFNVYVYAEVELEESRWGLPLDIRWETLDPRGNTHTCFDATGIPPQPAHGIPLVWQLVHEVTFELERPGRHDLHLYVDGELVGERAFAVELAAERS